MLENISSYVENASLIAYPLVFVAGVLTSFTPCIYPLIPILIGFIGAKQERSKFLNFLLSLSYVVGMAITFSILGAFAALTGRLFGQIQTNPWAHLIVGNIIIFFSLTTLGVITIPHFSFFGAHKSASPKERKKGVFSAFLMGLSSGFISASCTTAILGVLLAYVATRQNVVFGFTLLFTFAVGMGTLLLAIGVFTGLLNSLPKSGRWMVTLQKIFGLFMLGLGEYFVFKAGILFV